MWTRVNGTAKPTKRPDKFPNTVPNVSLHEPPPKPQTKAKTKTRNQCSSFREFYIYIYHTKKLGSFYCFTSTTHAHGLWVGLFGNGATPRVTERREHGGEFFCFFGRGKKEHLTYVERAAVADQARYIYSIGLLVFSVGMDGEVLSGENLFFWCGFGKVLLFLVENGDERDIF